MTLGTLFQILGGSMKNECLNRSVLADFNLLDFLRVRLCCRWGNVVALFLTLLRVLHYIYLRFYIWNYSEHSWTCYTVIMCSIDNCF